ncbi:TPA: ead/Ea22-like family protein, partial [Enterobacter kobei]
MSNIDKRALREAAEKAGTDNHTQDEWFHYLGCSRPVTVLALLDELEAADALNKHLELAIRRAEGCSEALRRKLEAAEER